METSMRTRMLAAVYAVLAACAGSEPQPTLTITPSGNQTVSGPVTITAGPVELANEVTWSTTVPGTISGDKGPSVVYHPPPSTQPVTVTAAARGQTKTVTFTTQGTALPGHTVTGLTGNVDVTYDQYDIPHIFCANQNDCYAVQGYIQAQDLLFQMDLFRGSRGESSPSWLVRCSSDRTSKSSPCSLRGTPIGSRTIWSQRWTPRRGPSWTPSPAG